MAKILVIDDERSVRNTLKDMLEYEGYEVDLAHNEQEGITKTSSGEFDFILCDAKYCKIEGPDIFQEIRKNRPDTPVLITSRESDVDSAVDYIKRGAIDFIEKPINLNKLLTAIKDSIDKSLAENNEKVKKSKKDEYYVCKKPTGTAPGRKKNIHPEELTGKSPKIHKVKDLIERVAPSDARVLITGQNGTGKELVARMIHEKSNRSEGPFVEVNCAAIPSELIESELFGHEKGAFTSAIKQRKGKFEQADGGTLFLDEIGDMSLSAQAKVLRALQENKISRVGSDKDINVNVRFVAATNKNLQEEIDKKNFREDLYHRLSVIVIQVPSLSERLEDLPILVDCFIEQISKEYGVRPKGITAEAVGELKTVEWTGNVRQLRNVIERLLILGENPISLEDVKNYVSEV
ncbi:MAG: sigma-54 dependent transcriptional regulator [Rikenellaceae bacterium]|nr:sigma-54 dependent transcriptional regulator [Rikenellaceae bacterium]